jgi:hypothetical protein
VSASAILRRLPALLLACWAVAAAAEEPALDLELPSSPVRVGDRVEVLAQARGGEEGWLWGELTVAVEADGPWALVAGPSAVSGTSPPAWELTLVPLELGELGVPDITVSGRPVDGDARPIGCVEAPVVEVVSVLGDNEEEQAPAPLRDPVGVRGLPWEWMLPVAAAALPILLAAAWWWKARRREGPALLESLPPWRQLEAALADLEARIGREPAGGICDGLAASLRRYLERRTGEPAGEMTSFELRLLARRRGWPETAQRMVQQVMSVADSVRFSRRPATDDELRNAIELSRATGRAIEVFLTEPSEGDEVAEGG